MDSDTKAGLRMCRLRVPQNTSYECTKAQVQVYCQPCPAYSIEKRWLKCVPTGYAVRKELPNSEQSFLLLREWTTRGEWLPAELARRTAGSLTSHVPIVPFERSRWRGRRFACYAPRVMPQPGIFIDLIRFCLIL